MLEYDHIVAPDRHNRQPTNTKESVLLSDSRDSVERTAYVSAAIGGVAAFGNALSLYMSHARGLGYGFPLRFQGDYDFSVECVENLLPFIQPFIDSNNLEQIFSHESQKNGTRFSGDFYRLPFTIFGPHLYAEEIEIEIMTGATVFIRGQKELVVPFHDMEVQHLNYGSMHVPTWPLRVLKRTKEFLGREKDYVDIEYIEYLQALGYQ